MHVNALPDVTELDFPDRLMRLLTEVTEAVVTLGGVPSGEHGDGRLRSHLLERIYGPELVDLFRAVKEAFDPTGILNPGVILAEPGTDPLRHLKAGADAAEIPDYIASALRRIETMGGWAASKISLVP